MLCNVILQNVSVEAVREESKRLDIQMKMYWIQLTSAMVDEHMNQLFPLFLKLLILF